MKYFPFKTLILCILLPPLLFVATVQGLEQYLEGRYQRELEGRYTGDAQVLFEGRVSLKEAVQRNVEAFLRGKTLIRMGVDTQVTVTTANGVLLYPAELETQPGSLEGPDPMAVASENFKLLSEGLNLRVTVRIPPLSLLPILILLGYLGLTVLLILHFYRRGSRRSEAEDRRRMEEVAALKVKEQVTLGNLEQVAEERAILGQQLSKLKSELQVERDKASATEEEMLEELLQLEETLKKNEALQAEQDDEMTALRGQIQKLEQEIEAKESKPKLKAAELAAKRFATVYKQLQMHERALSGYADLTEEMKIKAEEVIHQLDADPANVTIKRKVFGKKNRETVFEVLFAYKGRLYFRKTPQGVEVLVIGTKLTQQKDLGFLDRL
jgi:uncharacterized protein (DUF849 family)